MWRTHRESNPELTLRRGLFYPLNYECKLRILRKLVNDMAFSKTLPKTLPIFYSVVKNARYLAFFGLKSPIFAHFRRIHLALRRPVLCPAELQADIVNYSTLCKRCKHVDRIENGEATRIFRYIFQSACQNRKYGLQYLCYKRETFNRAVDC